MDFMGERPRAAFMMHEFSDAPMRLCCAGALWPAKPMEYQQEPRKTLLAAV
jgi:hypothetical protein